MAQQQTMAARTKMEFFPIFVTIFQGFQLRCVQCYVTIWFHPAKVKLFVNTQYWGLTTYVWVGVQNCAPPTANVPEHPVKLVTSLQGSSANT